LAVWLTWDEKTREKRHSLPRARTSKGSVAVVRGAKKTHQGF
jgi:hypothetical protein